MSSIYGAVGKAAHHAHVASKHAIVGMTRCAEERPESEGDCPPGSAGRGGMTSAPGHGKSRMGTPQTMMRPPEISSVTPVTQDDDSETR